MNRIFHDLHAAARKPFELVRRAGAADAAFEILTRIVAVLSLKRVQLRRYYVTAQPLRAAPARARGASISVREALADDAIVREFPRPQAEIAARFATGSRCLVAESSGRLLGFLWLHFGDYLDPEDGVVFIPQPAAATAWDFDLWIAPEHRTGLAFHRLWEFASSYLDSRGVRWSVSRVWASNDASIRAHRRLGAFAVASAMHLACGRLSMTFTTSAPFVQLVTARARPRLRVDVANADPRRFSRFRG